MHEEACDMFEDGWEGGLGGPMDEEAHGDM